MPRTNPKNVRITQAYLTFLEEAKQNATKTTDQVAAAIALFEKSTKGRDFAAFHLEQARAFKRQQYETTNAKTGKPLAKATIRSRLLHLKAFFLWLAGQPGYKSKIKYADADYFNPSANDTRIATARREKPVPSLEQIRMAIEAMPTETLIHQRNRAIMALAILTGARDDALASLNIEHCDLTQRKIVQDARTVRTKNRKTFITWFFPVGNDLEAIVKDWMDTLTSAGYGPTDPLFPSTKMGLDENRLLKATGLTHQHWKNAGAIRRIFKESFQGADLPYFNPHSFRHTLARLGETQCTTPEQFKAWSQNLGHENVLTTFTSYGQVSGHRQAEILEEFTRAIDGEGVSSTADDVASLQRLVDKLKANQIG
ncbi:MAG: tyrosine-type recombinase/integrase [Pseudomonadota bacterium]